jgi:hypothetical protein
MAKTWKSRISARATPDDAEQKKGTKQRFIHRFEARNTKSQRGLNPQIMGTMNAYTKGVRNRGSKRVPAPCRFVMPVPDCLGAVGSQFPPTFSFPLRQPNQYGDKPRMDGRERCFFNGPDEFAHASANHLEDLESNLGMNQAGGIEVLFTDEVDSGLVSRCGGCRISTTVKHWSLATELPGPSTVSTCSRPFGENLKDSQMATFNDEKSGTTIAFAEDELAAAVIAGHCPFGKKLELGLREICKNRYSSEWFRAFD